MQRWIMYTAISVAAIGALYLMACLHILSRLDSPSLIVVYVLSPNSPERPITFPIPAWVTDLYWRESGQKKISMENQRNNDHIEFVKNIIAPSNNILPYQTLDEERAQTLLMELICAKGDYSQTLLEITKIQSKWNSQLLGSANQRCGRGLR